MALFEVATAVIQLVGIVMVSSELSSDHHFQAFVPRIPVTAVSESLPPAYAAREAPGKRIGEDIETHTAVLAFPTCDYVSSRGWAPSALEAVPGILYVHLDGEQIAVTPSPLPDGSGATTERRTTSTGNVPQVQLGLPHLKKECCQGKINTNLTSAFQPPYAGAAAVVDFPQTWVQANACRGIGNRRDTRVTVTNGGSITFKATKDGQTKEIVIRGNSKEIYLANLPSWVFEPGARPPIPHGGEHYTAYFAMSDAPNQCNWGCSTNFTVTAACTNPPSPFVAVTARSGTTAMRGKLLPRTDLECSNSQWP